MSTRRQFLRDCSLATATAMLAPAALAYNPELEIFSASGPGFAQFSRHVNTPFFLRAGAQMHQLVLVAANEFFAPVRNGEDSYNEKFSLLFRGPAMSALPQDTYDLEHGRLGQLAIFIVPAATPDPEHQYYEAVFNRPITGAALAAQRACAPRRAGRKSIT